MMMVPVTVVLLALSTAATTQAFTTGPAHVAHAVCRSSRSSSRGGSSWSRGRGMMRGRSSGWCSGSSSQSGKRRIDMVRRLGPEEGPAVRSDVRADSSSSSSSVWLGEEGSGVANQLQLQQQQQPRWRMPARLGRAMTVASLGAALLYGLPQVAMAAAAGSSVAASSGGAGLSGVMTSLAGFFGMDGPALSEAFTNSGFFQAFSLVFVSEIGDKTFFIAGLLAAKTSRFISFVGAVGALAVMSILAVLIGLAFHSVPSQFTSGLPLDDIVAVLAFLYFGINTLKDAYNLPEGDDSGIEEELEGAEEEVEKLTATSKGGKTLALMLQVFGLVFAAEFGDRSFLTTIALGAAQDPVAVAGGAIAAHASATGIAVAGGALISQYISEKILGYISGTLFVVFAATTALGIF